MSRISDRFREVIAVSLLLCACTHDTVAPPVERVVASVIQDQNDTFDGTVIDPVKWEISAPLGTSTVTQNDALLLSSDGTRGTFCNTPGLFGPGAGVALRKKLSGDFDIQVDFSGFVGPNPAGGDYVSAFLNVYQDQDNQVHIKKVRGSSIDEIQTVASVGGRLFGSPDIFNPVTAGTFRITRSGVTITTFFNGTEHFSFSGFGGDVIVSLVLLSAESGETANIAFDNFAINSGMLVDPPLVCNGGDNCVSPPSGLVSWWPGEGNGNDVVGSSGGSLGPGVTFGPGEVGQAFVMDGHQGNLGAGGVDVGNAPSLHVSGGDFTVEAWVRFDAVLYDRAIVSKMTSFGGVPNADGWALIKQDNNHFWFCLGGGATNGCGPAASTVFSSTVAAPNTWYHIAAVKTSNDFAIYVNGVEEDRRTLPPFVDTDATDLLIGGGAQFLLNGEIDEVSIYNRALSAGEIQAIFNSGTAGKCPPPTASAGGPYTGIEEAPVTFDASGSFDSQGLTLSYDWDFGDGSAHGDGVAPTHVYANAGSYTVTVTVSNGHASASASSTASIGPPNCAPAPLGLVSWWPAEGDAIDVVGGNNGTPQSGATFGAGRVGRAFLFDGVDAYIDAGNASNLHVSSGDFTVEAWVRFNDLAADQAIVSKFTLPPVFEGWSLLKQRDNRFWYCLGGGTSNRCYDPSFTLFSTTVAETGRWYYIAAVKGAGGFSLYVNGVQEDARSPLPLLSDAQTANLVISAPAVSGAPVNGEVDEVTLYNRALDPSEIAAIYHAGSAGKCAPPSIQEPTASAGGPYTGTEGLAVSFDGSGSSDPQDLSLSYDWDFGDGSPHAAGVNPAHAYADNGSYAVTLIVSNTSKSSTATTTATIANGAPTVDAGPDANRQAGQQFALNASFADPGVNDGPWATFIDWGDGSWGVWGTAYTAGNISGSHSYGSAGTFTVSVQVTDKDGATGTDIAQIVVATNRPPVANAGGPYSGVENRPITLDGGASTDPDGDGLGYRWDVTGIGTLFGRTVTFSYPDNAVLSAALTVSDGKLSSSVTTSVFIANVPPTASFRAASPVQEGSSSRLALTNSADQSPIDQSVGFVYAFSCGGGFSPYSRTNHVDCPTIDNGFLTVRGRIRDKDGGVTEYNAPVSVLNANPVVTLRTAITIPERPPNVVLLRGDFTDAGAQDGPWSYTISWGDGTITTGVRPTQGSIPVGHTYKKVGKYDVTMTVTDKDGGTGISNTLKLNISRV